MKKLIDEKGRLFGIISPVDILVLLAVAAVALMAYGRFFRSDDPGLGGNNVFNPRDGELEYTVTVPKIREDLSRAVAVGDPILNRESGTALGVITGVEYFPCVEADVTPEGESVEMTVENYTGMTITGRLTGYEAEGRFFLTSNHELFLGLPIYFRTPYVTFGGSFTAIEPAE